MKTPAPTEDEMIESMRAMIRSLNLPDNAKTVRATFGVNLVRHFGQPKLDEMLKRAMTLEAAG